MNIAVRLKELRVSAGITQKELATSTGIALQSIINYENGRREPNSKAMVARSRIIMGRPINNGGDPSELPRSAAPVKRHTEGLLCRGTAGRFHHFDTAPQCVEPKGRGQKADRHLHDPECGG